MGLATAQARFLGITARKADCEYKSTELAQQKLEITNQLSDVAAEYSNALNSTMLIWQNDATNKTTNVTYSLLMTPSALNDYNPYMITTPSGAIVLNSEYAAAAKAAGISKAGGVGSQEGRDKFIAALVPGGIITQETAAAITQTDYTGVKNADGSVTLTEIPASNTDKSGPTQNPDSVLWNPAAGMGAQPLDKGSASIMQLSDLILSESIGQQPIDWTSMFVTSGKISETEYKATMEQLNKKLIDAKKADMGSSTPEDTSDTAQTDYANKIADYNTQIANARANGDENNLNRLLAEKNEYIAANPIKAAMYDIQDYQTKYSGNKISFDDISNNFQISDSNIKDSSFTTSGNETLINGITVVKNGIINKYPAEIEEMTIGDLLSGNIVLMIQNSDHDKSKNAMSETVEKLLTYIAKIMGYGQSGVGLNVDDASNDALEYALMMTTKLFLRPENTITGGSRHSDSAMTENSAYMTAEESNRIAQSGDYTAVSLSNMMSSFLTYFDNYLSGVDSNYVVGKTVDTSSYVTDDSSYIYVGKSTAEVASREETLADFFDELYNNICEHGWRQDDSVDDEEYLASAIKDGRYSMSSLNNDGYYYQTRYNETGYLVEVTDSDAISRAEAEYTRKKAELTYKEDSMDVKSKKLDAEISSLTSEYDTVKNLISKNIEKTFTMFSG